MAGKLEPLPGTGDIWEPEISEWTILENAARLTFPSYGYTELRTPIFERTDVFVRGIGDATDVVQKEMYTFEDRGGRSLTLRPEGTAGVMRAIANKGINQGEEIRAFYMGPMFRGERPAAGRRRQFHQVGVEAVGRCTPLIDAECIAMLMRYLENAGVKDGKLLINTRGLAEDRETISDAMITHFEPVVGEMCEDCRRRLHSNVWRILDCKNEPCQEHISAAPKIIDLLGETSRTYFNDVLKGLDALKVEYTVDSRLVRGLDYYEHTVFEVVHDGLGAQSALAGGGRYRIDLPGLKKPVEGVGFAAGMERLIMARESLQKQAAPKNTVDTFVVGLGEEAVLPALSLCETLRGKGFNVLTEYEKRSMKSQMRTANKLGAKVTLILGESELANNTVICKNMKTSEQTECKRDELEQTVKKLLESL